MAKINSNKKTIDGHEFDSELEAEYYEYLKSRDDVDEIILQPKFVLVEAFETGCGRCYLGKVESPKTGKMIQCKSCKGTALKARQAWTYRADFKVIYKDLAEEVIDVKGWANESFRLVRKMFEYTQGHELLVVKKKGGKWKYV